MENQLKSISKIFTEKLLRIPDYQRGYAWEEKQLKEFWADIMQLEEDKNHYFGVLTFEDVPKSDYTSWSEDSWIITDKNFEAFYIVDGQQRLTTTLILIQSIIDTIGNEEVINHYTVPEIRKKYIFDSKPEGISGSYIFGYHNYNPSYEFLKTKIFNKLSEKPYLKEETIYTLNLENAKLFFLDKLSSLNKKEIESIFKKVTQNFKFNINSLSSDIDVHVAFEVMNNRGKKLSTLELLKNRLIFLSTKFDTEEYSKKDLRNKINDCWKSVYHYLGKNKEKPLRDDEFLRNHFLLTYSKELLPKDDDKPNHAKFRYMHRNFRYSYINYLLDEKFTLKNIANPNFKPFDFEEAKEGTLTINEIFNYSESLQESVKAWYNIFNPYGEASFTKEEKLWLDKIERIKFNEFAPLLMVLYQKEKKKNIRVEIIKAIEKHKFVQSLLGYHYRSYIVGLPKYNLLALASDYYHDTVSYNEIISHLKDETKKLLQHDEFKENLLKEFKRGFYKWDGIRYFLFEWELHLKAQSKSNKTKINWKEFIEEKEDYITVEHIYPQKSRKSCWQNNFRDFTPTQKRKLKNSLGNLLPLSQPKNSSLSDKCFNDKKGNDKNTVGYIYGSYAENQVAQKNDWTPNDILNRGLKMLKFMEERWNISLGTRKEKIKLLGIEFIEK